MPDSVEDLMDNFMNPIKPSDSVALQALKDRSKNLFDQLPAIVNNAGLFAIAEHRPGATIAELVVDIPSDYDTLVIKAVLGSNVATTFDVGGITFNNDTDGTHYGYQYLQAANAASTAAQSLGAAGSRGCILTPGGTSDVADFASVSIEIPNYKNAVMSKVAIITESAPTTRASGGLFTRQAAFHWRDNSPITRVGFFPVTGTLWRGGCYIAAYGIKGATL